MPRLLLSAACLVALPALSACNCRPELPNPPDIVATEDTADGDDTGFDVPTEPDTAPEPPCAVPEQEPNNTHDERTPLPMEEQGCGAFPAPNDLDIWEFEHTQEGWLGIEVDARSEGSLADVKLVLTSPGGVFAEREDDEESRDAHLLFPAPPDTYALLINEQNAAGDPTRYFYDVMVSRQKEPVSWNRDEVEPNEAAVASEAMVLASGDRVLGHIGGGSDQDWFVISVPAGRHTLQMDIDAYSFGSAGDFTVWMYDRNGVPLPVGCFEPGCPDTHPGCTLCGARRGQAGWERDPWRRYESPGDEQVFIQVTEAKGRRGVAYWYLLSVDLEGP